MYMQIENIKVCNPITTLIQYLENKGFRIVEFKITDYHFHEVYIKMSGERTDDMSAPLYVLAIGQRLNLFMIKTHVNHLKSRSSLQQVAHNVLNSSCIKLGKPAFFA